MLPASAKMKGRLLQQWTRDKIIEYFPVLTKNDVRSTSMGAGGEDVQLSEAARRLLPFQIECKNKRQIAVCGWYEQAAEHGPHEPLLVIKENYGKPLVVLDAEYFLWMVQKLDENYRPASVESRNR